MGLASNHLTARSILVWTLISFFSLIASIGYLRENGLVEEDPVSPLIEAVLLMASMGLFILFCATVLKLIFEREAEKWPLFLP
ncbi:hypothetical protein FUA23_17715 [Neolewinella aurantiaca]|uniref:Uncharacterized protein n=1 Tax=Neolewinella aurantiaca TaxID=2602767 RepID=A0A5C7FAV8_9BACT|nr:hypothetical protein [Neolewinella aurantiaca]TXF87768.1 hypothetical protein FUA23_17715 [Neolewinella aurantiaca]